MKHIYTHRDRDGILWRFEGSRPVSELADQVMDEMNELWRNSKSDTCGDTPNNKPANSLNKNDH